MANRHSEKTLADYQKLYKKYDELVDVEKQEGKHNYLIHAFYVDKLAEETKYSKSSINQILNKRYKKEK